jgi:hypothetical protein
MIIIGVDFHPEFQQMASVDTETGEFQEKRLTHREEAEKFYRALMSKQVRVGMEASGHARWFERLLSELRFERPTAHFYSLFLVTCLFLGGNANAQHMSYRCDCR